MWGMHKEWSCVFCAIYQIVTCSDCQHHGTCLHDFGACWTIDDSLAASQDVKVYLRHMRTIAIWQLIAPMREAQESVAPLFVEHIANFEFKAADLKYVCRNKLSPDLACFTCKKQSVDFCSGCSLLLCPDHAVQHGRKTCNVLGLEDLVVGWQTQLSIRSSGRKAAHFVTDVAQLTPAFYVNVLSKKVVESMDELTQFIRAQCNLLKDFTIGVNYLNSTFLKAKNKKAIPVNIPEANLSDAYTKQAEAREILAQWEYASTPAARMKAFDRAKKLLTGQDSISELEDKLTVSSSGASGSKNKFLEFSKDFTETEKRVYLSLATHYEEKWKDQIRYLMQDCYQLSYDHFTFGNDVEIVSARSFFWH